MKDDAPKNSFRVLLVGDAESAMQFPPVQSGQVNGGSSTATNGRYSSLTITLPTPPLRVLNDAVLRRMGLLPPIVR